MEMIATHTYALLPTKPKLNSIHPGTIWAEMKSGNQSADVTAVVQLQPTQSTYIKYKSISVSSASPYDYSASANRQLCQTKNCSRIAPNTVHWQRIQHWPIQSATLRSCISVHRPSRNKMPTCCRSVGTATPTTATMSPSTWVAVISYAANCLNHVIENSGPKIK